VRNINPPLVVNAIYSGIVSELNIDMTHAVDMDQTVTPAPARFTVLTTNGPSLTPNNVFWATATKLSLTFTGVGTDPGNVTVVYDGASSDYLTLAGNAVAAYSTHQVPTT
jgi:hypothetical protein